MLKKWPLLDLPEPPCEDHPKLPSLTHPGRQTAPQSSSQVGSWTRSQISKITCEQTDSPSSSSAKDRRKDYREELGHQEGGESSKRQKPFEPLPERQGSESASDVRPSSSKDQLRVQGCQSNKRAAEESIEGHRKQSQRYQQVQKRQGTALKLWNRITRPWF